MTPEQRGKYARTLADFTPRKVIPVANCWTCDRCRSCKVLDGLTEEERKELQYGGIHKDCPLKDYVR